MDTNVVPLICFFYYFPCFQGSFLNISKSCHRTAIWLDLWTTNIFNKTEERKGGGQPPLNMADCDWRCSHMGHITTHGADLGSEESYQSWYRQNRRSPSCPEVGLWRPNPLGQQRPQGETNAPSLSLSLLLCPFPLSSHLTRSVSLRPTVCLSSPLSISITPLCSDLSQTQRGSLVYSHMEGGGGGGVNISRFE